MKAITINVSEPVYRDFQEYARRHDRTTSELIREAMEQYRLQKIRPRSTLRDLQPSSVGMVLREFRSRDDLLEEMLDDPGR
jgi:metal-responsive CopG/Arc/MetJ family transcriptional regulator